MIVGRLQVGTHFPSVGGDVVDLHGRHRHPIGRVAPEDVKLAAGFGHGELAVGREKLDAVRPFSRLLREGGRGEHAEQNWGGEASGRWDHGLLHQRATIGWDRIHRLVTV